LPPPQKKLKFKWSKVEGAQSYLIKLKPIKLRKIASVEDSKETVIKSTEPEAELNIPEEGVYSWEVTPLASPDTQDFHESVNSNQTEKSVAHFEVNRNAKFFEGGGYIALSTMMAPYTYEAQSPVVNSKTKPASSSSQGYRLSGEYFYHPQWGVGAGVEIINFTLSNNKYDRHNLELTLRHRRRLSESQYGWSFYPKVGIEMRDYRLIYPSFDQNPNGPPTLRINDSSVTAYGPQIGFDLRKQFNDRLSLGFKTQYFYPVLLSDKYTLAGDKNLRNISFALQGFYWLNKRFGLGAGAIYELRSISYNRTVNGVTSKDPDFVRMDSTYFFGSLIYTFGGN